MNAVLKKIQNGQKEELEQFIYDTYPKIYSYILRQLGNESLSHDLTQETFLRFMNRLYQLPSDTKMLNYLYRISHHLCMDYFRLSKRETEEIETVSLEKQPLHVTLERELGEQIHTAINRLSIEQKNVILLRYYQDLKIKEIAKILNEKESTIKTRLRLGIRKLKKILEGGF